MGNLINACCGYNAGAGGSEAGEVNLRRPSDRKDVRTSEQEYQNSYLAIIDPKKLEEKYRRLLDFKDFKGYKKVEDIHAHYQFFKILGKGSFGEVFLAKHIKADV